MAWIYDKNGQQKCEIKRLSYTGTFMEVSRIMVTVESPEPIDFAIGDYIDWAYDGLRYKLDTAAGVEKQARKNSIGNAFIYENLVFLSPLNEANHVDFFDVVLGNTIEFLTNTEFSFYGTAWDYAKRLEANLGRITNDNWKIRIWTNGVCYDDSPATGIDTGAWESKLVDVSGIKCLEGFQQIYNLWGCAYVFSVVSGVNYVDFYDDFEQYAKTWQVGGVDKIFAYGKGNGLYKIRHTPDADHVLVTRLRAYGSSENLPANYYFNSPDYHVSGNESSELAISHLMLPASQWEKMGDKSPANAYLDSNVGLYGVREGVVLWDGSDSELGEIKPTIYGLTIQDLLNLMSSGDTYRPVEAKWPDTTQRIDKIVIGAAPTDNGAVAEAGYDYTETESIGSLSSHSFGATQVNRDIQFDDLVMGTTPSVSHLADFRIVPTSENKVAVSFDIPDTIASLIDNVTAYLIPYVGGVKVEDATFPCFVSDESIYITSGGVSYTKRYKVSLLDSTGNPIVFSTMLTGAVTFHIVGHINFRTGMEPDNSFPVVRNEYSVNFSLLRGNKAIDKFFSVTVPQIGFDLAAAVSGSSKLCMRSGANQPREFVIVPSSVRYNESTDTWYIRCKRSVDQSTKTYFPNSDAVIASGDEYYLSGIAMPSLYVEIAAQKLLEAATAWLQYHSNPRMLSSVEVDNKIMAEEGIVLKEGMALPITDADLGITTVNQESRVIDNIRIEEGTDPIRTFSITLRDKKEKSSLDAAIRGATSDFATNSSVSEAVNAAVNTGHGSLTGRDLPNQHPISSISGLEEKLSSLSFFEQYVLPGNAGVAIKLRDEYVGLFSNGWVSSGGISESGGGGGGSVNALRDWANYRSDDTTQVLGSNLGKGLKDSIETLQGYFTNGVAKSAADSDTLAGHASTYYAHQVNIGSEVYTASNGIISLPEYPTNYYTQSEVDAQTLALSQGIAVNSARLQSIEDWIREEEWNDYIIGVVASGSGNYITGFSKSGNTLTLSFGTIASWALSANKPSYTFSEIGSKPTTLLGYGITDAVFGAHSAGSDNIPITLGSTTQNVLIAHQSLAGYVNRINTASEAVVGKQFLSGVSKVAESSVIDFQFSRILLDDVDGTDDLKSIEALTGTSGLLRKTGSNAWSLDTTQYITKDVNNLTNYYTKTEVDARVFFEEYTLPNNGGTAIKLKDDYVGMFASGFVSSGGISTAGGGGGTTVNALRDWENYRADDTTQVLGSNLGKGLKDSIEVLQGYFTGGVADYANDANLLDGHGAGYFAHSVQLGSTVYTASNGLVNIPSITTGVISDLETWIASKGFVTKSVNDLANYYTKSEVDVQTLALSQGIAVNSSRLQSIEDWLREYERNYVDRITLDGVTYLPQNGKIALPDYPTTLPASDVYAWAKASSKPSYTFSEIGSKPTTLLGYGITDAVFGAHAAGSDSIQITLGSETQNVLIAHQSLVGYVNSINTESEAVVGKQFLSGVSKVAESGIIDFQFSRILLDDVYGVDDLKAIEALTGTSGLLRKTDSNTWSLDTTQYITKDVNNLTNYYTKPEIDAQTLALSHGIAANSARLQSIEDWLREEVDARVFFEEYTLPNNGGTAIKLKDAYVGMFASGFVSSGGISTAGGGGGTTVNSLRDWANYRADDTTQVLGSNLGKGLKDSIETLQGYFTNGVAKNAANSETLAGHASTYYAHQVNLGSTIYAASNGIVSLPAYPTNYYTQPEVDAQTLVLSQGIAANSARLQSIEDWLREEEWNDYINGVVASGSGNYITGFSKSGSTLTLSFGTLASWALAANKPSYTFSEIGSKPTTLLGYGITDVYFGSRTADSDTIPITLGGIRNNVLTAHQSLTGYVNAITRSYESDVYECPDCDYVYNPAIGDPSSGIAPGTSYDDLPEDWVCPVCGASKENFTEGAQFVYGVNKSPGSSTISFAHKRLRLKNIDGVDDLKAIEALTGTSGLLRKTDSNTWSLDTTQYITKDVNNLTNYYTKPEIDAQTLALSHGIAANSARLQSIEDWLREEVDARVFFEEYTLPNNGGTAIKLKDAYVGMFASGFVSSGGLSTAGGDGWAFISDSQTYDTTDIIIP